MSSPKLHIKFPRPLSHDWIKFENNLPLGSSPESLRAAVHLDYSRRNWSIHTAVSYANELDQYIRWLKRTGNDKKASSVPSIFAWRCIDQGEVVHPSIFFEHAMVHFVIGLMAAHQNNSFDDHFDTAIKSIEQVKTYKGDYTSAYVKKIIKDTYSLCKMRNMTNELTDTSTADDIIDICKEALSYSPKIPHASNLHQYTTELSEFFGKKLCTAYAKKAAQNDEWATAEAAASVLGDEHKLTVQYKKLRMAVSQKQIPFETWLFSITDEVPVEKIPTEPCMAVIDDTDLTKLAHFDAIDI